MKNDTSLEASSKNFSTSEKAHGASDIKLDKSAEDLKDPKKRRKILKEWENQIKALEGRKKDFKKKLEAI